MDADPAQVTLGYPGVVIELEVRASRVTARFDASGDRCAFDVHVGSEPLRVLSLQNGHREVVVADGLPSDATTRVTLIRRNEAWQGLVQVLGFAVDGELGAAPKRPERKILCIGDSITAGEGVGEELAEPGRSSNGSQAYGWLLGRRFGADVHLVAYGGRGLIRDWRGLSLLNAPQFFERALPDDPDALWDHARWVPDLVLVALGANDFNAGIIDEATYVGAYTDFVRRIRETAPKAPIVLCQSPIFGRTGADLEKRSALLEYLNRTREHVGEGVEVADLEHQPGDASNAHPTGPQHVAIAAELAPVVRRITSWG